MRNYFLSLTFWHRTAAVLLLLTASVGMKAQTALQLVRSVSDLHVGDHIVLANAESGVALSVTQGSNNRPQTSVVIMGETLTLNGDVQLLTLGGQSGRWTLYTGDGYLAAGSSTKNVLATQSDVTSNAEANIDIDTEGNAIITFQGSNSRNVLRYNKSASLFSCYSASSSITGAVQIYREAGTTPPEESQTQRITTLSEAASLPAGTVALLYLSDEDMARVVEVQQGNVWLRDASGKVKLQGFTTNAPMEVGHHVAGYLLVKKADGADEPTLIPTEGTTSAWLLSAEPVTEAPVIPETPTGVQGVEVEAEGEPLFTVQGRYVGNDLQALPKGMYVTKGKKILKR